MATVTLNAKDQITIPAQIRAALGLQPGDEVEFVNLENGQFAMVASMYSVERLKGMIRSANRTCKGTIIASPEGRT